MIQYSLQLIIADSTKIYAMSDVKSQCKDLHCAQRIFDLFDFDIWSHCVLCIAKGLEQFGNLNPVRWEHGRDVAGLLFDESNCKK